MDRTTRRLSRALFYAMIRFGARLEKKQSVLARIVEIGAELFAQTAVIVRAEMLTEDRPEDGSPVELADLFCRRSRRRIEDRFDALFDNDDVATYKVAQRTMEGRYAWLEEGIIGLEALGDAPMEQAMTEEGREEADERIEEEAEPVAGEARE